MVVLNLTNMTSTLLVDELVHAALELASLQLSDAPEAEMRIVQTRLDRARLEVDRRMAW